MPERYFNCNKQNYSLSFSACLATLNQQHFYNSLLLQKRNVTDSELPGIKVE